METCRDYGAGKVVYMYSTGRSACRGDRKNMIQKCKIPLPKAIFNGFCDITAKELSSYKIVKGGYQHGTAGKQAESR